jgi:hypothetical protein
MFVSGHSEILEFRTVYEFAKKTANQVHLFPLLKFQQDYKKIDNLVSNSTKCLSKDEKHFLSVSLLEKVAEILKQS